MEKNNSNNSLIFRYSESNNNKVKQLLESYDNEHDININNNGMLKMMAWPPRLYTCSFCKKEFKNAQALGGHMNVHRRDRAHLRQLSLMSLHSHFNSNNYSTTSTAAATTNSSISNNNNINNINNTRNINNINNVSLNLNFPPNPNTSNITLSTPKHTSSSYGIKKMKPTTFLAARPRGTIKCIINKAQIESFKRQNNLVVNYTNFCPNSQVNVNVIKEGLDLELRLGYN